MIFNVAEFQKATFMRIEFYIKRRLLPFDLSRYSDFLLHQRLCRKFFLVNRWISVINISLN